MTAITLNRKFFLNALNIAKQFAGGNKYLPMLQSVELKLDGDALYFHATDLDTHYATTCKPVSMTLTKPVHVIIRTKPVHVIIRTKPLLDAVKGVDGDNVTLAFDPAAKTVTVTDEESRSSVLPYIEGKDEYPILPTVGGEIAATIPLAGFQEALRFAEVSTAAESSRFAIAGALFDFKAGELKAVATDGHRLSVAITPAQTLRETEGIISTLAVKVLGMLAGATEVRVFKVTEKEISWMRFAVGEHEIVARLADKDFPHYEGCIPKDNNSVATLPRKLLSKAVCQAAKLSRRGLPARAKWCFIRGAASVTLEAGSSDPEGAGSLSAQIPADYLGDDITIGLNPSFVQDFLAVVGTESVEIRLRDGERQVLMSPSGLAHQFQLTLMPTKL